MRKLLYLAAGAALLFAPAAFAQTDSTPSNQPSAVMGSSGTSASADDQSTGSTDQAAMPDPAAAPDQAPGPDPATANDQAPAVDQAPPPDSAGPPDQAAPPDQPGPPSAADQSQGQYPPPNQPGPAYSAQSPQGQGPGGASSNAQANQSSRLYAQQGEYQGQGVQVISNAPVPDTHAVRHMYPPLSRAGRRTAPAGN